MIQTTGHVSIHDKVFVGPAWSAVFLMDYKVSIEFATICNNSTHSVKSGIRLENSVRKTSVAVGNLAFAANTTFGPLPEQRDNFTATVADAANSVPNPSTTFGDLEFYPLLGAAKAVTIDLSPFAGDASQSVNFSGRPKHDS
jgi:hypothetical protein